MRTSGFRQLKLPFEVRVHDMSMYYIFQSWQVEANSISHLMTKSGTRQETSFLAKLFVTGSEPSHRNSKISCQSHFSSTFGVPEKNVFHENS